MPWSTVPPVRLTSQPTSYVEVHGFGDADAEVFTLPAPMVFTTADWNAPKTFTIRAVADGFGNEAQDEPHPIWLGTASADPLYAVKTKLVRTTIHEPRAPTNMVLTSSVNPSVSGQRVVFVAAIVPPAGSNLVVRKGTVTFTVDGVARQIPVVNGQARFATSTLAVGKHTIRAVYKGDLKRFGGSKAALIQYVQRRTPASGQSITILTKSYGTDPYGFPVITVTGTATGDVGSHLGAYTYFYGSSGPFTMTADSWMPYDTRQAGQPQTTTFTFTETVYGGPGEVITIELGHPLKPSVKKVVYV